MFISYYLGNDGTCSFLSSSGVEYDIDFDAQKVTVKSNLPPETVLQTVSKTGKKTAYWEEEAPAEAETKPAEAEIKPAEAETKPAEAVAAA